MGSASKGVSMFFRFVELVSASVVAGLVGEYLHYIDNAHAHANDRMVYAVAMAGISIIASIVLFPPLKYTFLAFLFDYALFICWMVVFGLLANLTGGANCTSDWYYYNWGYYWGGYYYYYPYAGVNKSVVGNASCGKLRAVLAWSMIGGLFWLGSGFLGTYVYLTYIRHGNDTIRETGAIEENIWRDNVGWHVQARRLGRSVGYNPGTKSDRGGQADVVSPSMSPVDANKSTAV